MKPIKTIYVKDQGIARWDSSSLKDKSTPTHSNSVKVGSIRIKLRSGGSVVAKPQQEEIEKFDCISCFTKHNVFERNIRGRILRGYLVVKKGITSIQREPGVPVKPCYHNGRLCEACFSKYTSSFTAPTDYKTIQYLKDVQPPTKREPVTLGQVEQEDALQEIALEAAQKDARPKNGKFAIEVGKVGNIHKDETVHVNAFRKFMQSRGGGVKDYQSNMIKKFDSDINFHNQKKG